MKHLITELCWQNGIQILSDVAPTLYDDSLFKDRPRLFDLLHDCEALVVRNQTQVNAELLAHAPALRVVGRLGVGLDNLDLNALRERGIKVVTGGNANAISVAEYTLGAMLTLARKLTGADASTKAGKWERAKFTGFELFGKTLGLIGMGDIGARVAKRAEAFGMRLIAHDPVLTPTHFAPAEFGATLLPLDEVLRQADFVSIHVPLLPSTRNLINAERLALMKPTAIVLNSSRGGIIDEAALAAALSAKRIGGAALDVRINEPPGSDDPLAKFDNVLLTPHVAGITEEAQDRICIAVAQDVLRVLRGERPVFSVNG